MSEQGAGRLSDGELELVQQYLLGKLTTHEQRTPLSPIWERYGSPAAAMVAEVERLGAAVAALTAENAIFRENARESTGIVARQRLELNALTAERDRLRDALAPFAFRDSAFDHVNDGMGLLMNVRAGDIRRVRAALAGETVGGAS